jgi:DNA processing protein
MPSERGKDWCRQLVLDLAAQVPDVIIVSGLAYGIDVVAHKAAMESEISTIIVPAHGLDRIYPAVHRNVAVQALNKGGILTEYTTGTEPERHNFVARNRIVAGMADAVVIVESKAKGGSLITAQMAQDYNRDVFALPGRFNDANSEGCNTLIKMQRAQLITSAEDLIQAMQWQTENKQPTQTVMVELLHDLTNIQRQLWEKLSESEDGWHVNQLVMELQLPYNEVAAELMMMELKGIVKGLPGGIWRRVEK